MKKLMYLLLAMNLFFIGNNFADSPSQEKVKVGNNFADSPSQEKVKVWGTCYSPYVRKVISVLEEKQIPYEIEPVLPATILSALGEKIPEEFSKVSPFGKIPAIQWKEFSISDSSVIVAYLEKGWKSGSSVYPLDIEEYAQALWFEEYADTIMTDVFHKIYVEKFVKPEVLKLTIDNTLVETNMKRVPEILSYLENQLKDSKGKYLAGDKLSVGDIAIAHHFLDMQMANVRLDLSQYPHLTKYLNSVLWHPSIQAAIKKI